MDPNAALEELRGLVRQYRSTYDDHRREDIARQFADTFNGLDEWISHGGFLPLQWAMMRR